jgi:hypothetical protein
LAGRSMGRLETVVRIEDVPLGYDGTRCLVTVFAVSWIT